VAAANLILTLADQTQGQCPDPPPLPPDRIRLRLALSQTVVPSAHSLLGWVHRHGNRLQVQLQGASKKVVASPHRRSLPGIIFLTLPTQADQTPLRHILLLGSKNILPPFNAPCAQNDLPERTIYDLTFALIPTSAPSCVLSVAKLSLDSMIGSGTRVCILARRNLFAKVSWALEGIGAVVANLLEPTLWAGIFDQKLAGHASSLCLTKKPPNELERAWWSSNSKHSSQQALFSLSNSR